MSGQHPHTCSCASLATHVAECTPLSRSVDRMSETAFWCPVYSNSSPTSSERKPCSMSRVSRPVSVAQRFLLSSTHVSPSAGVGLVPNKLWRRAGLRHSGRRVLRRRANWSRVFVWKAEKGEGFRDGVRQVKALEGKKDKKKAGGPN